MSDKNLTMQVGENVRILYPASVQGPTARERAAYRDFRDLLDNIDMGAKFLLGSSKPEFQHQFIQVNEERMAELTAAWEALKTAVAARP